MPRTATLRLRAFAIRCEHMATWEGRATRAELRAFLTWLRASVGRPLDHAESLCGCDHFWPHGEKLPNWIEGDKVVEMPRDVAARLLGRAANQAPI